MWGLNQPQVAHGSVQQLYTNFITPYAMEKLQSQIDNVGEVKLHTRDENRTVVESPEGQLTVSPTACECTFYKSMKLLCKHILFVRSQKDMDLFSEDLVKERWTRQYYRRCHRVFMQRPLSTITVTPATPTCTYHS